MVCHREIFVFLFLFQAFFPPELQRHFFLPVWVEEDSLNQGAISGEEHLGNDDPWLLSKSESVDSCMKFSGFSVEWLRMEQIIWPRVMGFCAIS